MSAQWGDLPTHSLSLPPPPCGPPQTHRPQVLKALGRGSYGTVYKVQRLADGQVYAMKETDIGKMSHQERSDAGEGGGGGGLQMG
jgi:hypothetical protein